MATSSSSTFTADASSAGRFVDRFVHARDVLRVLIARDMKLRYRGSFFGMAWTLLNPLTELVVLVFIFDVVLPLEIPHYAAFLFTGLIVNTWFQSSLFYSTVAVVNNRELIRRPDVPLVVLPIVSVASALLHFMLSMPVLFGLLIFSGVQLTNAVFALPLLMAVQFLMILALAYPLTTIHVWFRDTQYLLRVALQLMFFLTPIFYEASQIPERFQTLYHLNPMVGIIEGYRDVLVRGVIPAPASWLWLTAISSVMLICGLAVFRLASHRFVDEL